MAVPLLRITALMSAKSTLISLRGRTVDANAKKQQAFSVY
jgi:hypothetical protein